MKRILAIVLCAVALAVPSFAQESFGQVLGTVTDPTGAAVPDAQLTLSGPRVPNGLTTTSGADGSYLFAAVPIGTYSLTISRAGLATLRQDGLTVQLGSKITYNPALKVGQVNDAIQVSDSAISL